MEDYLGNDMESQYEVVIPFVLRGLLIHLMNDNIDDTEFAGELPCIVQLLELLLNSFKEASVYFERYLTQLSNERFTKVVRLLQELIT